MNKKRLFEVLQIGQKSDKLSYSFDIIIVISIITNIIVLFLKTFDELSNYMYLFDTIEWITMIIFTIEYILRLWTAPYLFPTKTPLKARLSFMISFDGIIDLLTILPFFFLEGFVVFRMLRVVRIFHLFRINAQYDSFNVITAVLYEKRNQLASSIFIILILMLASSLSMYQVEHTVQPENFKNAFSGLWWSTATLLTVGYGDIYPITTAGKVMAIIITFLGVGVVAIPTGIISAGFVEHYSRAQNSMSLNSLQTVVVDIDSLWIGKHKDEIDYTIVLVERDGVSFIPSKDYTIELKDVLIVTQL